MYLLRIYLQFSVMPQYLGNSIETVTQGGKLFTTIGDKMTEVVFATSADLAKLPYDLAEGMIPLCSTEMSLTHVNIRYKTFSDIHFS